MKHIKFSINNWNPGTDYPDEEPFRSWVQNQLFNHTWCRQNRICVVTSCVDMSNNFCITAQEPWVLEHCPSIIGSKFEYTKEDKTDCFGTPFLRYDKKNFGSYYYDLEEKKWDDRATKKGVITY